MKGLHFLLHGIWVLLAVMGAVLGGCAAVSRARLEPEWIQLAQCSGFYLVLGLLFRYRRDALRKRLAQEHPPIVSHATSFRIVAALWVLVPILGCLPYLATGAVPDPADAVFESVSGFTTTGSTIIGHPERLSSGLLLWRSASQWIGGLGLVLMVFFWSRESQMPEGASDLIEAEFSGASNKKLHPQLRTSMQRIWRIYILLTLFAAGSLLLCGNSLLESVCLSLSAVSTGGFMTRSTGLTGFGDGTLACLSIVMILSGINVATLYQMLHLRQPHRHRQTQELRLYLLVMAVSMAACAIGFTIGGEDLWYGVRHAVFHVASTLSTCGFYMDGGGSWPVWVRILTMTLVLIGACSGSTGGGIKWKRIMIVRRYVSGYFTKMLHSNAVTPVRIDEEQIEEDYVGKVFAYVFLYISALGIGALLLMADGESMTEGLCLAAANLGNLGPNTMLQHVGLDVTYTLLGPLGKWTLMTLMLAGRLELFALVGLLVRNHRR